MTLVGKKKKPELGRKVFYGHLTGIRLRHVLDTRPEVRTRETHKAASVLVPIGLLMAYTARMGHVFLFGANLEQTDDAYTWYTYVQHLYTATHS